MVVLFFILTNQQFLLTLKRRIFHIFLANLVQEWFNQYNLLIGQNKLINQICNVKNFIYNTYQIIRLGYLIEVQRKIYTQNKIQSIPIMNFFKQYHKLFDLPPNAILPQTRLTIDNQLFIEKPYLQTYSQSHTLNSKLKALKKDYNQFQNQINQLQHLQQIPKRSNSRRKEPQPRKIEEKYTQLKHHSLNHKNSSNIFNLPDDRQKENKKITQNQNQIRKKDGPIVEFQNQTKVNSPIYNHKFQDKREELFIKESPKMKLLDELKRKTQEQTQKLRANQNKLWNKIYEEDNNVLKHSQINHVFNSKLVKENPRLEYMQDSTIPKMFGQRQNDQFHQNKSGNYQNQKFTIRERSKQTFTNRDKIVPQKRQPNKISGNNQALQRRKRAKQNIDERRQKLKDLLRAFW